MLTQVTNNVWYASHFGSLIGGKSDAKMTIVRNSENELMLVSPIPINDQLLKVINKLGVVSKIIAPNPFHNLYFEAAIGLFPNAEGLVAPGLTQRMKKFSKYKELKSLKELNFNDVLIELYPYRGEWRELLFYVKEDQVLIVTDLCFNLFWANTSFAKFMFRLQGIWEKFTVSKVIKLLTKDKKQAREVIDRIIALPKKHIVMAHGNILSEDVDTKFEKAFNWLKS
jgi:predicted CopG family antitoxin